MKQADDWYHQKGAKFVQWSEVSPYTHDSFSPLTGRRAHRHRLVCTRAYVARRILPRVRKLHFGPAGSKPRSQRGQGPAETLQGEDAGTFSVFLEEPASAAGSLSVVQLSCLSVSLSHLAATFCSSYFTHQVVRIVHGLVQLVIFQTSWRELGCRMHSPWVTTDGPEPRLRCKYNPNDPIPAVELEESPEQ